MNLIFSKYSVFFILFAFFAFPLSGQANDSVVVTFTGIMSFVSLQSTVLHSSCKMLVMQSVKMIRNLGFLSYGERNSRGTLRALAFTVTLLYLLC